MSYYDEDKGYVGYDPLEAAEERIHKERYHKSEVPTTLKLLNKDYYNSLIEKSKLKLDGESSIEEYINAVSYSISQAMMSSLEDIVKHEGELRLFSTTSEHIIPEGMESHILYRTTRDGLEVIGVFFDKDYAEKIIKKMEEMIVDDE